VLSTSRPFSENAIIQARECYMQAWDIGGLEEEGFEEAMDVTWAELAAKEGVKMGVDFARTR
jgi:hypothetical protein